MDFSAAQRRAFIDEYVSFRFGTLPGLANMSEETQHDQRARFEQEAERFLIGCVVHFQRSVLRLKNNGALVPRTQVPAFESLTKVLLGDNTTLEEFDGAARDLQESFPSIARWLEWWFQPSMSCMIFPARSSVDPSTRRSVPRTSNPVEAKHSLLHRASGTGKALVPGLEGILLYTQEVEGLYEARKG